MMQRAHDFLFEEVDARDVAAMRIALGLLLALWWVALWPDLEVLMTAAGPVDIELLESKWSRWRFGPFDGLDGTALLAVHLLGFGAVLAFTVGWFTPFANVVVLFLLAAYWHRSPWIQNGGDRLLRIFVFYMCFSNSGRAWSVDAWRAGRTGGTVPVFAIRLVQLQVIVMYTYTGLAKTAGTTWAAGTALYYSLSDTGYARFPALFDALLVWAPVRGFLMIATWISLVWEIAFGPLVLWSRTRNATLWLGLLVHLGIFATLAVGIFSWATLWGYLAFLPAGWAARGWSRIRRAT